MPFTEILETGSALLFWRTISRQISNGIDESAPINCRNLKKPNRKSGMQFARFDGKFYREHTMMTDTKSNDIHSISRLDSNPEIRMMGKMIFPDERLLRALHNSRLVDHLYDSDIVLLTGILAVRYLEAKELTSELNEAELKDAMLILVEGEIEVSAMIANEPLSLSLTAPGDIARVVSFVGDGMVNIRTRLLVKRDSVVMLLRRSRLETLLYSNPALVYGVMRNLVMHVHGVARRKNAEKEELSNYFYQIHGRY